MAEELATDFVVGLGLFFNERYRTTRLRECDRGG